MSNYHGERFGNLNRCQLSKSFTVIIRPLSTRLIKAKFRVSLSHRRSTTVSLETRILFFIITSSETKRVYKFKSANKLVTDHSKQVCFLI